MLASAQVNVSEYIVWLTLKEEWQEGDKEDQENRNNASLDPLKRWNKVVTSALTSKRISSSVHFANRKHLIQSSKENHYV
jgi:hypothetical protein